MKLRILALLFTASSLWAWDKDGNLIVGDPGPNITIVYPAIYAAGDGGMYFLFANGFPLATDSALVRVQRIDGSGGTVWKAPVTVCEAIRAQTDACASVTASGGLIVAFINDRIVPIVQQAYVSRVNHDGSRPWGRAGVRVTQTYSDQRGPRPCLDATGEGVIVVWSDFRPTGGGIWVAGVLPDGRIAWEAPVCTTATAWLLLDVVPSGKGVIAVWRGLDGTRAQRLVDGVTQWDPRGMLVIPEAGSGEVTPDEGSILSEDGNRHNACTDGSGGAIVFDNQSVQRIDSLGFLRWNPRPVLGFLGGLPLRIAPSGDGGVLGCYSGQADLSDTMRFYIVKVTSGGNLPWGDSLEVWKDFNEDTTERPYHSDIVSDGQGGAVVALVTTTWELGYEFNVYALRVDSAGRRQWLKDVCTAPHDQYSPMIVREPHSRGYLLAWYDERNYRREYFGTLLDSLGNVGIAEDARPGPLPGLSLSVVPNPFHGCAEIRHQGELAAPARLEVVDALGRVVQTVDLPRSDGRSPHSLLLTPLCPPGVYFVRLVSGSRSAVAKVVKVE